MTSSVIVVHLNICFAGIPTCGCGQCDVYKVFNRECERPSGITIPGIASQDHFALTPSHPISIDQLHILQHTLSSLLHLLDEYASCLRKADPDELIVLASAFYDGELKARFRQSDDPVTQLYRYIREKNLWVSDEDLEKMKDVAEEVKCCEGILVVEKMQSLFGEVIKERTVPICEAVTYPSYYYLPRKRQFVFILDDDFRQLPFSESVFFALYYRVRTTLNSDGYIAFVTLQTALAKGLKIRSPS